MRIVIEFFFLNVESGDHHPDKHIEQEQVSHEEANDEVENGVRRALRLGHSVVRVSIVVSHPVDVKPALSRHDAKLSLECLK